MTTSSKIGSVILLDEKAHVDRWWYSPVLPLENKFPFACRQTLTSFLLAVSSHLSRKRPADTFLDFLTNSSSIVIVFLSELASVMKIPGAATDASVAVHAFLEANPTSSLANVLDVKQQSRKLNVVAEDILQNFVEPRVYACEPVRIFLREILAGVVLEMTVTSCSRPEFINSWIIYALEESDTGLLEAIDAGVDGARVNGSVENPAQTESGTLAKRSEPANASQATSEHRRTVSRAEDAMDEAMQEARRLTELIAAEEAKKGKTSVESSSSGDDNAALVTPGSSRDDLSTIADEISTPEGALQRSSPPESSATVDDTLMPLSRSSEVLAQTEEKIEESSPSFTTFDQILSSQKPTALQTSQSQSLTVPPLTLFNANISIFDDSQPGEKGTLRSKPTTDYLIQIEPATSQHPGWMIARKYTDFETLHEVLRRISKISGVAAFSQKHENVPTWKSKIKEVFRTDLEEYLKDSLSYQRLAESEGMKRFLEKDQGLGRSSPGASKGGFGFPSPGAFETMGKGMLDVLASAPKGAAGGGRAIIGGVTGVLGGGASRGQRKQASSRGTYISAGPPTEGNLPARSSFVMDDESQQNRRLSLKPSTEDAKPALPPRHNENSPDQQSQNDPLSERSTIKQDAEGPRSSFTVSEGQGELHLPPPPSEIPDDYNIATDSPRQSMSNDDGGIIRTPTSTAPTTQASPSRISISTSSLQPVEGPPSSPSKPPKRGAPAPLSSQETSVAVELFFAAINELFKISSAWKLRLTLLNAAKSFLLRPGNPNLEAIRVLLQDTVIDANTTDSAIATHLRKLRDNALPTEEELKAWPPPPSDEEKERMRQKARKLLVEKGMPQALTSVIGAAASGEALGKVFDCLQVPEVARGLIFALVLQGVRAVTQ